MTSGLRTQTDHVQEYLQQQLSLSDEALGRAMKKHDQLRTTPLEDIREVVSFLCATGLRRDVLTAMVRRQPDLLTRPRNLLEDSVECVKALLPAGQPLEPLLRASPRVLLTEPGEMQAICSALRERGIDIESFLCREINVLALPHARLSKASNQRTAPASC